MSKDPTIILVVGGVHSTISVVAEALAVSARTAPLDLGPPPISMIEVKREIEMPDFDIRPLREKPKRDWEQRQKPKRRR